MHIDRSIRYSVVTAGDGEGLEEIMYEDGMVIKIIRYS